MPPYLGYPSKRSKEGAEVDLYGVDAKRANAEPPTERSVIVHPSVSKSDKVFELLGRHCFDSRKVFAQRMVPRLYLYNDDLSLVVRDEVSFKPSGSPVID